MGNCISKSKPRVVEQTMPHELFHADYASKLQSVDDFSDVIKH